MDYELQDPVVLQETGLSKTVKRYNKLFLCSETWVSNAWSKTENNIKYL